MKICLADTYTFKKHKDDQEFLDFVKKLNEFLTKLICDTRYLVYLEGETERAYEFKLEYLSDVLETTEGMFSAIATITNFLMQFLENNEILAVVLIIFRRLYNFFPTYRKHLEDPMVLIFINVL